MSVLKSSFASLLGVSLVRSIRTESLFYSPRGAGSHHVLGAVDLAVTGSLASPRDKWKAVGLVGQKPQQFVLAVLSP